MYLDEKNSEDLRLSVKSRCAAILFTAEESSFSNRKPNEDGCKRKRKNDRWEKKICNAASPSLNVTANSCWCSLRYFEFERISVQEFFLMAWDKKHRKDAKATINFRMLYRNEIRRICVYEVCSKEIDYLNFLMSFPCLRFCISYEISHIKYLTKKKRCIYLYKFNAVTEREDDRWRGKGEQ